MRHPGKQWWVGIVGLFLELGPTLFGADWPQWRGPHRDGLTTDPLPATLTATTAPLWRHPSAHGYASPIVQDDQVIFLDDTGGQETAHALNLKTGNELWQHAIGESYTDEFEPGPRCTPLAEGDRLYVQTCRGEFQCLKRSDGTLVWHFNFKDYGTVWINDKGAGAGAASRRGNAGAPVIVGDAIYVQIGSAQGACIGAFHKLTGKLLWKSQNDLTCYSSLMAGKLAGRDHLISATVEGLLALQPETGDVLWRVPFRTGANRNALTPILDDTTVYFSSHTTGMRATEVKANGPSVVSQDRWFNPDLKINLATPVLVHGHLFGQGPARNFICVDAKTGRLAWSQPGFGEVTSTISDGSRLLLLTDRGELLLAATNPDSWQENGRFQACGKTFVHPAYANGTVYVRDSREIVAWPLNPALP